MRCRWDAPVGVHGIGPLVLDGQLLLPQLGLARHQRAELPHFRVRQRPRLVKDRAALPVQARTVGLDVLDAALGLGIAALAPCLMPVRLEFFQEQHPVSISVRALVESNMGEDVGMVEVVGPVHASSASRLQRTLALVHQTVILSTGGYPLGGGAEGVHALLSVTKRLREAITRRAQSLPSMMRSMP